jgi:ATP-binding protein involved in chromosome partitioning
MENRSCPTKEQEEKKSKKHLGIRDVRYVVAVGSGKGGVGKTTISTLLSLGLKEAGYATGIFDLDFYGPNVPLFLGEKRPPFVEYGKIKPIVVDGVRVVSLGLLVAEGEPIFMRGLMAGKLLQELTEKVEWGPLDFLILDLPPGTGDIFLTMLDLFEMEGFVLVTTSHKLAISDAVRTLAILKEKQVPVLGVVKNMADLFPDTDEYFRDFLEKYRLSLLAEVPVLRELAKAEKVEDLLADQRVKGLISDLGDKLLDRVFRVK